MTTISSHFFQSIRLPCDHGHTGRQIAASNSAVSSATSYYKETQENNAMQCISSRIAGIAMVSLRQLIGNVFIEEMIRKIEISNTPFVLEETANGVVRPVTK